MKEETKPPAEDRPPPAAEVADLNLDLRPREGGVTCPYCMDEVADDLARLACTVCKARHHLGCIAESRGRQCGTCGGRIRGRRLTRWAMQRNAPRFVALAALQTVVGFAGLLALPTLVEEVAPVLMAMFVFLLILGSVCMTVALAGLLAKSVYASHREQKRIPSQVSWLRRKRGERLRAKQEEPPES